MAGEVIERPAEYDENGIRYADMDYLELSVQPDALPGLILPQEATSHSARGRHLVDFYKFLHEDSEIHVDISSADTVFVMVDKEIVEAPRKGKLESDYHDALFNEASRREREGHRPLAGIAELIGMALRGKL